MLKSLAASSRGKTQRIVLDSNEHCSVTGKLFNETVNVGTLDADAGNQSFNSNDCHILKLLSPQSLVHLNNRCLPDVLNDIVRASITNHRHQCPTSTYKHISI